MKTKIFLVAVFVILLFPMWWMITGSLQDINGVMVMPPKIIPLTVTLENYDYLLKMDVDVFAMNTLRVVLGTVGLSVFLSVTAGYWFGIYKSKFKKILFSAFMAGLMIPRISLLIPLYVILKNLGLSGTIEGVILTTAFSPIGIYLAKNYFDSIPKSILESARIDGASEWQILRMIVVPISKPIVAALSLFAGIGALQDYIWQMLVLQDDGKQTLLIAFMKALANRNSYDKVMGVNPVGKSFAVGVVLLLPLVVIFLMANKYFVKSLGGAVKE